MARDGHDGERKHRNHRRRRHSGSEIQPVDDESARLAAFGSAFERPADLAALREARLTAMATPATTRKKMKSEVPQAKAVKPEKPKRSLSEVQVKPKEKDTSRLSAMFGLGRIVSTVSARPRTSRSKTMESTAEEQASQYVYRQPGIRRRDFQVEADARVAKEKRTRSTPERLKSTTDTARRHRTTRSTTEPSESRNVSAMPSRPSVRRSKTSASTRPAVAATKLSEQPRSDVVSARPASRRTPSILGSIFSAPVPPAPEKRVSCLTCGTDDILRSRTAKLACSHRMCHSCLKRIFKLSVKDPAHMPPRCCTQDHISLAHVDTLFDDDFKRIWNRKYKEYTAKNKIYCPQKGCGEWIQPKHMFKVKGKKIGRCPLCKQHVCCICNGKAHRRRECPQDPALKQLTEIAEQKGWRKCFNCSAMVELKEGCNHMTCRCTAEFCMVCGLKWKSCDCAWFNYEVAGHVGGDPVRYQQELDRRREQERQDAELARRMQDVRVGGGATHGPLDDGGGMVNHPGLLARARGLFAGWIDEGDRVAGTAPVEDNTVRPQRREPLEPVNQAEPEPRIARRRGHRGR